MRIYEKITTSLCIAFGLLFIPRALADCKSLFQLLGNPVIKTETPDLWFRSALGDFQRIRKGLFLKERYGNEREPWRLAYQSMLDNLINTLGETTNATAIIAERTKALVEISTKLKIHQELLQKTPHRGKLFRLFSQQFEQREFAMDLIRLRVALDPETPLSQLQNLQKLKMTDLLSLSRDLSEEAKSILKKLSNQILEDKPLVMPWPRILSQEERSMALKASILVIDVPTIAKTEGLSDMLKHFPVRNIRNEENSIQRSHYIWGHPHNSIDSPITPINPEHYKRHGPLLESTSSYVNPRSLERMIQDQSLSSVDEFIAALPVELRKNFTLAFSTRNKVQHADPKNPRIVLFSDDGRLQIALAGRKDLPGGDSIEMSYQNQKGEFEYFTMHFKPDEKVKLKPEKKDCVGCHGNPPKPIWDGYPIWANSYGSNHFVLRDIGPSMDKDQAKFLYGSKEVPALSDFLGAVRENHPDTSRYQSLIGIHQTGYGGLSNNSLHFSDVLSDSFARKFVYEFLDHPKAGEYLPTLLREVEEIQVDFRPHHYGERAPRNKIYQPDFSGLPDPDHWKSIYQVKLKALATAHKEAGTKISERVRAEKGVPYNSLGTEQYAKIEALMATFAEKMQLQGINGNPGIRLIDSVANSHGGENIVVLRSLIDELATRDPKISRILQYDRSSGDVGRSYRLKQGFEALLQDFSVPKKDGLTVYTPSGYGSNFQAYQYVPNKLEDSSYWTKIAGRKAQDLEKLNSAQERQPASLFLRRLKSEMDSSADLESGVNSILHRNRINATWPDVKECFP